jgi:hypothetical protein
VVHVTLSGDTIMDQDDVPRLARVGRLAIHSRSGRTTTRSSATRAELGGLERMIAFSGPGRSPFRVGPFRWPAPHQLQLILLLQRLHDVHRVPLLGLQLAGSLQDAELDQTGLARCRLVCFMRIYARIWNASLAGHSLLRVPARRGSVGPASSSIVPERPRAARSDVGRRDHRTGASPSAPDHPSAVDHVTPVNGQTCRHSNDPGRSPPAREAPAG